jgi:hypothetical protein
VPPPGEQFYIHSYFSRLNEQQQQQVSARWTTSSEEQRLADETLIINNEVKHLLAIQEQQQRAYLDGRRDRKPSRHVGPGVVMSMGAGRIAIAQSGVPVMWHKVLPDAPCMMVLKENMKEAALRSPVSYGSSEGFTGPPSFKLTGRHKRRAAARPYNPEDRLLRLQRWREKAAAIAQYGGLEVKYHSRKQFADNRVRDGGRFKKKSDDDQRQGAYYVARDVYAGGMYQPRRRHDGDKSLLEAEDYVKQYKPSSRKEPRDK